MGKLVVGPLNKGLRNDYTPFNIDNDNFPTLENAYQWRARVKRKRGTQFLCRLERFFNSTNVSYSAVSTIALVAGATNILTGFSLQASGNIVPGSVTIINTTIAQTYTDVAMDGTLSGNLGGTGTINYATGAITITAGAGNSISASFLYYPGLPVMGLEDLILETRQYPATLAFDTVYSYIISNSLPYLAHDVSFYKNPATGATGLPGYVQKTNWTPTTWNGQDYQQFWTVNYQGALWATNGINMPFSTTNIGMQFKAITNVAIVAGGPPAIVNLTIAASGLVIGDFLFINEIPTTVVTGINFQTGYVINVVGAVVTVEFPNATIAGAGGATTAGIAQYLTNRSDVTRDCIRWFDGDPTDGNATTPGFSPGNGWVNFCPPLSQAIFSISDNIKAQYYLVGARMIVPFKDRLLFIGPVIQTSAASPNPLYLKDTIIYSQNGTPYYTASFTGDPLLPTTVFNPILLPTNQTSTAPSWWEDQTGFGGFAQAGVDEAINSVSSNEDVLILGFDFSQSKLVYSGNDIIPFNFYTINSEYGTGSTFSAINMDEGVITRGSRGIIKSSQVAVTRVDPTIPDENFQIKLSQNGAERVCAQRNFITEWVYFTYPSEENTHKFPTKSLLFNYRDNSWATMLEAYTTYGQFRKSSALTWATVGSIFGTWAEWDQPWNTGSSSALETLLVAGNQQGYVLIRDIGTGEGTSLAIQSFSGNLVTVLNHCLNEGDYIVISGAIGTVSTLVNAKIFSVYAVTANTFRISPSIGSGTYFGGGQITRMYIPFIQTRQFPSSWEMGRKTRIGVQQYLLSTTQNSKITLLMFLSQNSASAYNEGSIVPATDSVNSSLIYSTVLYTCPESANIGLSAANTNLQMPTAVAQSQIWHRKNTSLIGDTVQLGFTMSDDQMREIAEDGAPVNAFSEIELHGFILEVTPSSVLA